MLGLPFTAPVPASGPRPEPKRKALFLLPLLAHAALQLFAGLVLARLADLGAPRSSFLHLGLALAGGLGLGEALLAGLGVLRLRAVEAPFGLRFRGVRGRLGEKRGAERQQRGGEQVPEHWGVLSVGGSPGEGFALQRAARGPR